MDEERNPLPPMVPMPPGDHIIVCDPFIDDFAPATTRPQCAYANIAPGMAYNSQPPNPFTSIPAMISPSGLSYYDGAPCAGVPIHIQPMVNPDVAMGALGRLFPGDQSVIVQNSTSPTHPYIPPVFPCGLCRREILDNVQAVQCYLGCKFWFHRTCVGLSEETFQHLLKDPYAEWMCDPCYETKKDAVDDGQYKIIHTNGFYSST